MQNTTGDSSPLQDLPSDEEEDEEGSTQDAFFLGADFCSSTREEATVDLTGDHPETLSQEELIA